MCQNGCLSLSNFEWKSVNRIAVRLSEQQLDAVKHDANDSGFFEQHSAPDIHPYLQLSCGQGRF